jgi:hypothetical protein
VLLLIARTAIGRRQPWLLPITYVVGRDDRCVITDQTPCPGRQLLDHEGQRAGRLSVMDDGGDWLSFGLARGSYF